MKKNIAVVVCTTICVDVLYAYGMYVWRADLVVFFFPSFIAPFMFHYSFHCCLYIIPALWPQPWFRFFFWKEIFPGNYATVNENFVVSLKLGCIA